MKYISTRGKAPVLNFEEAMLTGLARDGGLYVPETIPSFSDDEIQSMVDLSYEEIAFKVIAPFVGDCFSDREIMEIINRAYAGFGHSERAPLVELENNHFLLELFHGPTLAFKDFAMQLIGQFFQFSLERRQSRVTIVGATSGDTGSAAIEAFRGLAAVDVFILYPDGRVSDVQRKQMTTPSEKNVHALAINGHFDDCQARLKDMFNDWQAQNITSVLHEKRGGYSNNTKSMYGLAKKVEDRGVRIISGVEVKGLNTESGSSSIKSVDTSHGIVSCDKLVVAPGPWARDFWEMLGMPKKISLKDLSGELHHDIDMWRFWQLEEGVLQLPPEVLQTNDGKTPPVVHVDTDAPLHSCVDGSLISDEMWGIYYKPDWHFNGIQGGASPYKVDTEVDKVAIDPYGPSSPEFVASDGFAHMWVSALAHCHKRFEGMMGKYHREASGGIGCFTADSFPVFDHFHDNATLIADSNHGWKMIGVGHLIADEFLALAQ